MKKNLFISNLAWHKKDNKRIFKIIKKYKISGIDIAPIRLNNNWENIQPKLKIFQKELRYNRIKVNAVQGIFFKTKYRLFNSRLVQHQKIINHVKMIINVAKLFNSKKIIIGSSYFRNINKIEKKKADIIFINFFKKLIPLLSKNRVYLCIETIPRQYGENYLYKITDTINLVKKINSKYIGINFDSSIYHFKKFDKSDFSDGKKFINNIQISQKNFDYFNNPSNQNLQFLKFLKKQNKFKDISLEIITKKTNIHKLSISLKNFNQIIN